MNAVLKIMALLALVPFALVGLVLLLTVFGPAIVGYSLSGPTPEQSRSGSAGE